MVSSKVEPIRKSVVVNAGATLSAANISNGAGSTIQNAGTLTATTGPISIAASPQASA